MRNNIFDTATYKDLDHTLIDNEKDVVEVESFDRCMTEKTYQAEENGEMLPYSTRWSVFVSMSSKVNGGETGGGDDDNSIGDGYYYCGEIFGC